MRERESDKWENERKINKWENERESDIHPFLTLSQSPFYILSLILPKKWENDKQENETNLFRVSSGLSSGSYSCVLT